MLRTSRFVEDVSNETAVLMGPGPPTKVIFRGRLKRNGPFDTRLGFGSDLSMPILRGRLEREPRFQQKRS